MEVKIYFESKEDLNLSIQILQKLHSEAEEKHNKALKVGTSEDICNCFNECDLLIHLIATLKNKSI
jgi:hypothetical protein